MSNSTVNNLLRLKQVPIDVVAAGVASATVFLVVVDSTNRDYRKVTMTGSAAWSTGGVSVGDVIWFKG